MLIPGPFHAQEVSNSVEEVYELRRDLQVLAEAFKEKEDEGIVLQNALVEVEVRYQEIQSELEVAKVHEVSTSTELASTLLQLNQAQVWQPTPLSHLITHKA